MERLGPKWTYGLNMTNVDQIGLKWIEYDQCGPNGPNRTKVDQRGQNGLIKTNVDQIGLLNIYHFYCTFRGHISNL